MAGQKKTAIVLFNLGGPEKSEHVYGFLYNLFSDSLIIRLPYIFRKPLAFLIARRRTLEAQERYNFIGGGSPLLENTKAQAKALDQFLIEDNEDNKEIKIFIAMRYWHPFAQEAVEKIKKFMPDEVILLPLYPQYSTATTESSFRNWREACRKIKWTPNVKTICCWPDHKNFIAAHEALLRAEMKKTPTEKFHVLFSAHGLPERTIRAGDPYQQQTEMTASAIAEKTGLKRDQWSLAYQSRVGPLSWIGPDTSSEIRRLAKKVKTLFLVPVSFVSEHIETLVELDIELGAEAKDAGLENYIRVPALGTHRQLIACLADLVRSCMADDGKDNNLHNLHNLQNNLLCPHHVPGSPCTKAFVK